MAPEIAVVVPVHNVAAYLPVALDSLRAQTFGDFECLLVENHSADESPAVARDYAARDPRFRYLEIAEKGPGAARNAGMDAAAGKYLYFLDGDDAIHPRSFEWLRAALLAAGADLAVAQAREIREHDDPAGVFAGDSGGTPDFTVDDTPLDTYYRDHAFSRDMIWGPRHLHTMVWNKLYRAELAAEIRFGPMLQSEDMLFTTEILALARRAAVVKRTLYAYRRRTAPAAASAGKAKGGGARSITGTFTFAHVEGQFAALESLGAWECTHSLAPETRRRLREHIATHIGMVMEWAACRSPNGREARRTLARVAPLIRAFEGDYFPIRGYLTRKNRLGCRFLLDWRRPGLSWALIAGGAAARRFLRRDAASARGPAGGGSGNA